MKQRRKLDTVKLREARVAWGESQERLAGVLGVTRITVASWESGRHQPHPWHIARIARHYKIRARQLQLAGEDA